MLKKKFSGYFIIGLLITHILSVSASENQYKKNQYKDCGLHPKAQKLAQLIVEDKKQNRSTLICNPLLAQIALAKAQEMAELGRVDHIGRSGANRRLIEAGYPLSKIYPRMFQNNVEAIAAGFSDPKEMWQQFKNSDGHRTHLLAEHEFYALQNEIAVGYYRNKKTAHVDYWVVYVAHQQESQPFTGEVAKSKD